MLNEFIWMELEIRKKMTTCGYGRKEGKEGELVKHQDFLFILIVSSGAACFSCFSVLIEW